MVLYLVQSKIVTKMIKNSFNCIICLHKTFQKASTTVLLFVTLRLEDTFSGHLTAVVVKPNRHLKVPGSQF